MTKGAIVELVLRRLEGGDYADSQFTEAEVAFYVETAFNKLYKVAANDFLAQGLSIPDSTMLAKFEVTGTKNQDGAPDAESYEVNYYEIELPVSPVSLPNGLGLFKLYPKGRSTGGARREFVPVPNGQQFLMQSSIISTNFLENLDHYEWEGGRTVFAKFSNANAVTDTTKTFIVFMLVNNFKSLSDSVEINLPQEMVNDIVTLTVQLLSGVQEDDSSTNFNNKPAR